MTTLSAWLHNNRRWLPAFTALIISSVMSIVLIVVRVNYSGSSVLFDTLVWNLFLAWIPLGFAIIMWWMAQNKRGSVPVLTALFIGWVLFFPNSPYIITDLLRLNERAPVPLWYDLMVIFSFAWNGLILGFLSLWIVQQLVRRRFGDVTGWVLALSVLAISGFGIYLGRFRRWNSWDVLTAPQALAADITDRFINPFAHPQALAVTILYSGFLMVAYITLVLLASVDFGSASPDEQIPIQTEY